MTDTAGFATYISQYTKLAQEAIDQLNYGLADYYLHTALQYVKRGQAPEDLLEFYIENQLRIFEDLATSANMFSYNYDIQKGKIFGWKALRTAMDMINFMIDYDVDYKDPINRIKNYFPHAKNALLAVDDEYKQVIALKLQELEKYFEELTDNIPDDPEDVHQWTETQNTSISFMLPKKPPSFMFLTPDGRFINFTEATEDLTSQNTPINHLVVSLLTATREMFLQTSFSGSGLIEEIDMGEHALILKSTDNIVIVAIVTFPFDEIREFTSNLAKSIDQQYGEVLQNWAGDSDSVAPMVDFIKHRIRQQIVGKY